MRSLLTAVFAFLAFPAQAQTTFLEGIYLEAGPGATASVGGGAGPGFSVEAGWMGSRIALFAGGTGGFVANSHTVWSNVLDSDARLLAEGATRSTLATLDYGIEYHFTNPNSATTPFVGISGSLPVYATERRDADERVSISGRGISARVGLRREVLPGVAIVSSVAPFFGSLSRGFVGEEGTGRAIEVEPVRVRGIHTKLGITFRPGALPARAETR